MSCTMYIHFFFGGGALESDIAFCEKCWALKLLVKADWMSVIGRGCSLLHPFFNHRPIRKVKVHVQHTYMYVAKNSNHGAISASPTPGGRGCLLPGLSAVGPVPIGASGGLDLACPPLRRFIGAFARRLKGFLHHERTRPAPSPWLKRWRFSCTFFENTPKR